MILVTVDDIQGRFPRPLDESETIRAQILLEDAVEAIEDAFDREGRDFVREATSARWLQRTAGRVVREMVSAALHVGMNPGVRSVASSTGPTSDTVTWADVDSVGWAGVLLTDEHRAALGLAVGGAPSGKFPPAEGWPEVIVHGPFT